MPPIVTQGQGSATLDKERQIGKMLDMNMQIVRRFCAEKVYYHFDINAGSGWNEECGGVPGSPIVFVTLAEQYLRRWQAVFYEIDYSRATELQRQLRGIPRCHVEHADNCAFLGRALSMTKYSDVGTVLADPNGWLYRRVGDGIGCPVSQMMTFFAERPKIDLIANLNLRFYKQAKGAQKHGVASYRNMPKLEDMRSVFSKRNGLITLRSHNGHSQFIRLILRSMKTGDYQKEGWYHLDSPQAKEIYRYAESSRWDDQLKLFEEPA